MAGLSKFSFFGLIDIVLAAALVFIAFQNVFVPHEKLWQPEQLGSIRQPASECMPGQKMDCVNAQGCAGERACAGGAWNGCVITKLCTPGHQRGCIVDSCRMGHETCNACGTAYENCVPDSQNGSNSTG